MDLSCLKVGRGETPLGTIHFLADRDPSTSSRPIAVILHGVLRYSEHLKDWLPVLSQRFDVLLVDLPGHGRAPPDAQPGLQGFIARLRELIQHFAPREAVVVGESVGGLAALALADGRTPALKGVVAADPPLTTAKQWCIRLNLTKLQRRQPTDDQKAFIAAVLGFAGGSIVGERIYYPLVENVRIPTLILTGDLPLFPASSVLPADLPCVLDDVDKMMIDRICNPCVRIETVPGRGHVCLDPASDQARRAVMDFCAACVGTAPAEAAGRLCRVS